MLSSLPAPSQPQIAYPVRMGASAGYRREFTFRGGAERRIVGDQTLCNLARNDDNGASIVGTLVPLSEAALALLNEKMAGSLQETVSFEHIEWLGWMDPPEGVTDVLVVRPGPETQAAKGPPTFGLPMLQSYVDDAVTGALTFGEEFASEWLDTTYGWSRSPSASASTSASAFA